MVFRLIISELINQINLKSNFRKIQFRIIGVT